MQEPSDPLATVRAYIAADADIARVCDTRVHVGHIPTAHVKEMPRCAIVLTDSGGNPAEGPGGIAASHGILGRLGSRGTRGHAVGSIGSVGARDADDNIFEVH